VSDPSQNVLSSARLALAIKQLREEKPNVSLLGSEPVAIVGIGCRFPGGVRSAREYWRLLHDGVDAITTIPPDRWDADAYFDADPQAPEKMNSRWGGFVPGVDLFDPVFFGISPREAVSVDPQQRLALEIVWEALWDSGRAPGSLSGSRAGVFMAICGSDYERLAFEDAALIGPQSCAGAYHSVASGRVSFLLNLRGPSISVDTACSSSLVAVHLACQSLRAGDCNLALAGGVTLHLLPGHYIGISKLGMLSPDGRCKAFDSRANGFVPSEGCGVVVLKLLADALRDGDRVYAVVRGTAVNQDGSTNVLTAPNGLAQQEVVRAALQNGQVPPSSISYVETHGTGTALGDPIEVEALAEVVGANAPNTLPCALGAAKTNIGHLEAAAGIAGLIKAALALDREEIPPNLHYKELNPHISLQGTRFYIPTQPSSWPRGSAARFAGVSSFGFGGTNAHIVLEEAPQLPQRAPKANAPSRKLFLLPISARTPEALQDFARRYQGFFREANGEQAKLYNVCHSAATRRDHYEERLAVVAGTREEFSERLAEFLNGTASAAQVAKGRASQEGEGVVFVFSGQGSQWPRMGSALFEQEPVFRAAIEECHERMKEFADWRLIDELLAPAETSKLSHTEYAQPAIFAVEVALTRLWQSWGVTPLAVIGHSAGEIAAAHVAGVLDMREAARLVVTRGRLMERATGFGKMATVALPASAVAERIRPLGDAVSIAAMNSPKSTVIAGAPEAVQQLTAEWTQKGVACVALPVDYAFHSAQMQPFSEELVSALGTVAAGEVKVPILSTLRGARVTRGTEFDANYWGQNIRRPVLFANAVHAALEMKARTFLEVGPHPVLLGSVGECSKGDLGPENLLPAMRRGKDEIATILASLGKLYAHGAPIAWPGVYSQSVPPVSLPAYPYQRQRYWLDRRAKVRSNTQQDFCGACFESPSLRGEVFQTELSADAAPFLADHRIEGSLLVPMTAFLELADSAVSHSSAAGKALADVSVLSPLALPETGACTVQTIVEDDAVRIFSLQGKEWKLHASCRLAEKSSGEDRHPPSRVAAALDPIDPAAFYQQVREHKVEFGPSFRVVESLRAGSSRSVGRVRLANRDKRDAAHYRVHPALLDGCLQTALAAAPGNFPGACLPFSIDRVETFSPAGSEAWALARVISSSESAGTVTADIDVVNDDGKLLVRITGLHLKRRNSSAPSKRTIYQVQWQRSELPKRTEQGAGTWLVVAEGDAGRALAEALEARGRHAVALKPGDPLEAMGKIDGVVKLVSGGEAHDPFSLQPKTCGSVLSLAQEMLTQFPANPPRLCLVTRGAIEVVPDDRAAGFAEAPVWGLGRTLGIEHPELRCVRVDLDPAATDGEALADAILHSGGEEEIALRGGERYVPRLEPTFAEEARPQRLVIPARGSIDNLATEAIERREPRSGEVEVEVEATALNFRDVLNVLGMYPGDPGPLGVEFCGRIARLGHGVEGYQVGDRVMGLAWGSFASFVTTPAAFVTRVPAGFGPVDAATIPNAFLTAHHCLIEVGKLQRGERVLIHAATGGVGLAAVQVALQAGAEIFATAGSEQKREYLRSLGVPHVFHSRTLDFAAAILEQTGGKGVDLVLNSLAGEFIDAGFRALAEGGRFIEIGKTGIWSKERVAALGKAIRYFVVDLAINMQSAPGQIQSELSKISGAIATGSWRPLPAEVFDFRDAAHAFRLMAQAKHIGKIVLQHPTPLRISPDASYLVSGGLGALGLQVAEWMAKQGARNLVLLGRSAPSTEAAKRVAALREAGVRVEIRAVDVSRRADFESVLGDVRTSMPPLRGIVHAAGVLDDGVLTQQTWSRFEKVMAPKIAGAWNLHELTLNVPLDFFVLFSSMASLTGSPGQAGYAAGNAFLDAFAHYRKARGLPALSINWGAWPDGGMAANVEAQGKRRVLPAIRPMPEQDCLAALSQAAAQGAAQLAIADVDWAKWENPPRLLSGLARRAPAATPQTATDGILERLQKAPASNRRKVLLEYLREEALDVLGLGKSHFIDERQPLIRMGLDSLMAVEFRNRLVVALKRPLTATLLFDYPNLGRLADFLEPGEAAALPAGDEFVETLGSLSDAEAEEMLKEELGQDS
jgi:acyl transferase domain-containing protein/NADPH:quinone reductase-like Zn-dependent oxidoreductase